MFGFEEGIFVLQFLKFIFEIVVLLIYILVCLQNSQKVY